jgi:two-component system, sensor histidine kinase and response regulator
MQLFIAHQDAATRTALARTISEGWDGDLEVIESGEGTEAVEVLLQDDAPRLAVVDWDLPGLDGPELCRLVRDYHLGGPPYIVLLAAHCHADIETGLEAGANDCIRMPAGAAEIRERVDAGRRFVQVPWERAGRGAMLEAVRTLETDDEPGNTPGAAATLEAVCSPDIDDEAWDALEGNGANAGAHGHARRSAQLLSLLN